MKILNNFLRDEQGQDLVEYTLILAFVALAAVGVYQSMRGSISSIWSTANSELSYANSSIS